MDLKKWSALLCTLLLLAGLLTACGSDDSDDYADYGIRTQRAREISKEEVYEILRKMEKAGHVHQVFNTQGHDTTCFICNCCGCGCEIGRAHV